MDIGARIGEIAIFAELPARARARLVSAARLHALEAGETSNLLEPGETVLFVLDGKLRTSALVDGQISFQDHEPGSDYGLSQAVAGEPVPGRAMLATEASSVIVIPAAAIVAALQSSTAAALAVARLFAARVMARAGGEEPGPLQLVFRDILRAARPTGESRWTLDPMPRHRELAARAGVSEESAAAAIAHLVRLGVARRRYPALDIEDRDALRRLAG